MTRTATLVTPVSAELGGGIARTTKQPVDASGKFTRTTETLSARENHPEGVEVWTVTAICDDSTLDLRTVSLPRDRVRPAPQPTHAEGRLRRC